MLRRTDAEESQEDTAPPGDSEDEEDNDGRCFLTLLLDGPHGATALRTPPPPPKLPPGIVRRPLPQRRAPPSLRDLERELDDVTRELERLRAQRPPAAPPPAPPPWLPPRDTAALLCAFGAAELWGGGGGQRDPQLSPIGSAAPDVHRGLRGLRQLLGALRRLQTAAMAAQRLEGARPPLESQLEVLQQRHCLPHM